jgi:hypothetical protein
MIALTVDKFAVIGGWHCSSHSYPDPLSLPKQQSLIPVLSGTEKKYG